MDYTSFGKAGLQVSKLCLGTMTFDLQCNEAQSQTILDAATTDPPRSSDRGRITMGSEPSN